MLQLANMYLHLHVHVNQAVDVSLNRLTEKLDKLKRDLQQLSGLEFMFKVLPGGDDSDGQVYRSFGSVWELGF